MNLDARAAAVADQPVFFNPFEDGYFEDPYDQYARLRERDPVHNSPLGVVICFGYDDVRQVLRDPRTSMVQENALPTLVSPRVQDSAEKLIEHGLINIDPPDHTRLRRLMSKTFTLRRVEQLRDAIQAHVGSMLSKLEREWRDRREPVDLIQELAFPLPFTVISEMLGMPEGDREQLRGWAHAVTKAVDPVISEDDMAAATAANRAMNHYVATEVLPWKRARPGDDLLTALLAVEDDGDRFSEVELLDQVTLIYMAGHETTVNLIGNGALHLLRHRPQLKRLQSDLSLLPNAVDELNRYDSAVQFAWRIPMADFTVGGVSIPTGQMLLLCLGSANRDPNHFGDDADRLDLGRANANEGLSFGGGVHYCLGAALARLEAEVAIGSLIRRFPSIALAGDPDWNGRIIFRGLDRLNVTLG